MSEKQHFANSAGALIVSDDKEFARTIVARWQIERSLPEITVISTDLSQTAASLSHRLVIIGLAKNGTQEFPLLATLRNMAGAPLICVLENERDVARIQAENPHALAMPRHDGWVNTLILLSAEALKRTEAVRRALHAERAALESESQAALGKYMLEMRPSINNALTSVLGNADLLLTETEIGSESREQIQTLQAMALRLNEIMQRFSFMAAQMKALENQSLREPDSLIPYPAGR